MSNMKENNLDANRVKAVVNNEKKKKKAIEHWTAPHLLDSMLYWITSGVLYYAKRNTEQEIYSRIQKNCCRNHAEGKAEL